MAKTLLQYSCLYILPFLFGVCMCGIEDEQFLTAVYVDKMKYAGIGKFVVPNILEQAQSEESPDPNTKVILETQVKKDRETDGQNFVAVYTAKRLTDMNEEEVIQLLDNKADPDPKYWALFPIHKHDIDQQDNIDCTISVFGGMLIPNIFFWTPKVRMFGYNEGMNIRFLGNDLATIQQFKQSVSDTSTELKMAIPKENQLTTDYYKVKVNRSSIKVSGMRYMLDLTITYGDVADPFDIE